MNEEYTPEEIEMLESEYYYQQIMSEYIQNES